MNRSVKITLTTTAGAIVILLIGGFIYLHFFFKIEKAGPIKGVQPDAWAKLQVGMTKQEVGALLGEAPSQLHAEDTETNYITGTVTFTVTDFWEYTWQHGYDMKPSDKAHIVYFDSSGRVSGFREPIASAPANGSR
jgi:outer membrane protein assembly factor BamE (lipoprotein component of BamABCDE complex)